MIGLLGLLACAPVPGPTAPQSDALATGQWVWSAKDLPLLAAGRASGRDFAAGVHIATVHYTDGAFVNELALSPGVVEPGVPLALVVRLDDSVNESWSRRSVAEIESGLDAALGRTLGLVHDADVDYTEVQIDYDVPVAHLAGWATVVEGLRASSLRGETVWVTSLVSHLRDPTYGTLFRHVVAGHILQVFDTGDDPVDAGAVGALAEAAGLPYRLGVGAFERAGTDHRGWFAKTAEACLRPLCGGVWVFPAGRPYLDLLGAAP